MLGRERHSAKLDDGITIVILANTNLVDTDRLGFRIARHLLGRA